MGPGVPQWGKRVGLKTGSDDKRGDLFRMASKARNGGLSWRCLWTSENAIALDRPHLGWTLPISIFDSQIIPRRLRTTRAECSRPVPRPGCLPRGCLRGGGERGECRSVTGASRLTGEGGERGEFRGVTGALKVPIKDSLLLHVSSLMLPSCQAGSHLDLGRTRTSATCAQGREAGTRTTLKVESEGCRDGILEKTTRVDRKGQRHAPYGMRHA